MKTIIPLLLISMAPAAFAEMHGSARDIGEDGLAYSIYALAASVVISSIIIGAAINNRRK